jgi:hypothetical protein
MYLLFVRSRLLSKRFSNQQGSGSSVSRALRICDRVHLACGLRTWKVVEHLVHAFVEVLYILVGLVG